MQGVLLERKKGHEEETEDQCFKESADRRYCLMSTYASVDVIRSINFSNMNSYGAAAFATVGVAMCMAYAYGQHEKYKYGGRSYDPVKDVTYKHNMITVLNHFLNCFTIMIVHK